MDSSVRNRLQHEEFFIHKAERLRKNCVLSTGPESIPAFLIDDGAISIIDNNRIELNSVEASVIRHFPVYICWEKVSEENYDRVPGQYGTWPKDNGATTLTIKDGKLYDIPCNLRAALISEKLPQFVCEAVTLANFSLTRRGNQWKLIRTDWGEPRIGELGKALWVEYGEGDISILSLDEESAKNYFVIVDRKDVGLLTELF